MADQVEVRCTCAGCCTVIVGERFKFDNPEEWFFEFFTRASSRASLGYRLKLMWRIFRRHEHYLDCVLVEAEGAKQLAEFFSGVSNQEDRP